MAPQYYGHLPGNVVIGDINGDIRLGQILRRTYVTVYTRPRIFPKGRYRLIRT